MMGCYEKRILGGGGWLIPSEKLMIYLFNKHSIEINKQSNNEKKTCSIRVGKGV